MVVEEQGCDAVQIEGLSERAAARRFGIDPRTVAKMMRFSVPPGSPGARLTVDLQKRQIDLPEHRTKNHRPHIVPLADEALALLPEKNEVRDLIFGLGAGGFGGWSKAKAELVERTAKARPKAGGKEAMPA